MKIRLTWLGVVVVSLGAASGCGGNGLSTDFPQDLAGTAPPDASEDASAANAAAVCTDAVSALCDALMRCEGVLFQLAYSDLETCEMRNAISCQQGFGAMGSLTTADDLEACALALPQVTCDDLYQSMLPAACAPIPGTLANGSACGTNAQCKSTFCALANGSGCGVCGPLPVVGTSCANKGCGPGLTCSTNVKTCVTYTALGSLCDADHPCLPSLSCVLAINGKAGTCKAPLEAGAPCTPDGGQCDALKGLFCNAQTKVCTAVALASAGGSCGLLVAADGGVHYELAVCLAGGHCAVGDGGSMGTCLAPAADGAPCDDTSGPTCLAPARCVSGLCKLDNPATCM